MAQQSFQPTGMGDAMMDNPSRPMALATKLDTLRNPRRCCGCSQMLQEGLEVYFVGWGRSTDDLFGPYEHICVMCRPCYAKFSDKA